MKCLTNFKNGLRFFGFIKDFSFYKRNSQLYSFGLFNRKEKFLKKFQLEEKDAKNSFVKNEFKLNINNQKEIDNLVYLLNSEIKIGSTQIKLQQISNANFFENLKELSTQLELISYNNFIIFYKDNQSLFETIKNMILSDKFKLDDMIKAKGVLSYLYLLDNKKTFNLTRDMNDNILNKILYQLERNFKHININEALECTMMLAYFGISLDVRLLERKIKQESSNLCFKRVNYVKILKIIFKLKFLGD
jgi:hypothetical protein